MDGGKIMSNEHTAKPQPVLVDQTWQYHFCNAWRQARSDRHIGRDRREPRSRNRTDRQFWEIVPWRAGYEWGWDSDPKDNRPYLRYLEWEQEYVKTHGRS